MNGKIDSSNIKIVISAKLKEIEERENVRILHAVESGSRAWGFASPDSDYDVRFIYIRPLSYYLELQDKKDFIDWELNDILDINGWDITKVLRHFHKSNAVMFEWADSPVVYYTTAVWDQITEGIQKYFSCKSTMYHYYGAAKKNYTEYLTADRVRYKKYFYVLRPILACKWIEKKKCPPPVLFQTLVDDVLASDMKETVSELVAKKCQMAESEKGVRIEKVNNYIEENMLYFKNKLENMTDDRNSDWKEINNIFASCLLKVYGE